MELRVEYGIRMLSASEIIESSSKTPYVSVYHEGEYKFVREDRVWFWSEEWQLLEAEADKDISEGHYECFDNMDEFIDNLDG